MATIDASIPLSVKQPAMMGKISDMLGIQGQQSQNAALAAQAQQSQQDLQERNDATDLLKNPDKYGILDANGVIDPAKAIPAILRKAPKTGGQYVQPIMDGFKAQLEVSTAAQNLETAQRTAVNTALAAVVADPKAKYGDIVDQAQLLVDQNPTAAGAVKAILSHLSPNDPMDATRAKLKGFGRAVLGPSEVAGAGGLIQPRPTMVPTGSGVVPGSVDPTTGGFTAASAEIPMGIPPGFQVVSDPRTGNTYLLNSQTGETRDFGTGFPGKAPRATAGGGSPTAPTSSIPKPYVPGEAEAIVQYRKDVDTVREQGQQAPLNRAIYQQVLKLADETSTGKFMAALQSNSIISQNFGDNFQELNKYLEKNAIANMVAMGGPPSDGRLQAAAAANGGVDFNPAALKAVTRFNYATNTALEQYREGIDKAVGTEKPDYMKLPDFKANWAKNFDVNVFLLENAIKDGDKKTATGLLNSLSPKQAADLMQKRKNLDSLAKTGRLPQ